MLPQAFVHYTPWLVILAILICLGTGLTTLAVYSHLLAQASKRHPVWLLLTGFCAGSGLWTAHFVAMLAYEPGFNIGYNPWLMIAAFVAAVVIATVGLGVSLQRGRAMIAVGGAIVGFGIAAMHFLGMLALIVAGTLQWNFALIAAAALLAAIVIASAMLAHRELRGWLGLVSGATLFVGGVCAHYFVAVAALTIQPAASTGQPIAAIDTPMLAITATSMIALVLLAGYVVAFVDKRAMRENFTQMGDLIDATIEGLVIADSGVIVHTNTKARELCGRTRDELVGRKVFGGLLTKSREGGRLRTDATSETRFFILKADGTTFPVEVTRRPIAIAGGNEVYAIRDLREREEAASQLAEAKQELDQKDQELRKRNLIMDDVLSQVAQGVCMYDEDQRVVICNERFATLYGLPGDAIQPGMSLKEVVQKRIDNGAYVGTSPRSYMEERTAPVLKAQESIHELNNGQIIAVARWPLRGGWVSTHEDIGERRRLETQISRLANHDALTDLPSRKALRDKLGESLAAAARHERRIAVLMIGVDRLNEINNALGHDVGDAMLQLVAKRLRDNSRKRTVLGRFSDDQFIVAEVVEHTGRDAGTLISTLQEEIRKPFAVNDTTNLEISTTVGITLFPADGTDADTLLKNANLAQHQARIENRGSHRFFEAAMDREMHARRAMEHDLADALERREFELHYQPLVDLGRSEITGFEAFLRWKHPANGMVSPGSFLPLAEEIGLINAIEAWTLQEACKQAMQWPRHLTVAVNVSVSWFRSPDFVQSITQSLADTGLTADRLQIEVTEKVLHDNASEAVSILRQLFSSGVRVVLDDFGAGFSSLSYLRQFPFHKIKIDRSFVAGLSGGEDSRVIVRTLARLGTGMRIATTAEGVETKEQFDIVRAEGCTEMQGHYFSPPKTAEEIGRLLLKRSGKADAVA